ncbi:hypothetical protein TVNIR_2847 [Thioalkalivibrio nitratireducens DSM 14787]|uniref:Prenyltransferase n=1 Tax=Thioalkalivibrio nitratireducens (strain DSM 14787 / UNIQEM 213 / ALEN2) TaxID=1255043 RepID=L0DZV1_THIND|nr:hypothetical protein [Thioalkalivibrio nitratireducens]AGA34485.1 hypothetical protein TVNIR_2847 [Thioalkalivibrio nitratireducens DSM 14787]
MAQMNEPQRLNEWFVPSFGPPRFRVAVGLLFLPYTAMVLSFTVIGAMLAETVHWDRVAAIVVIYFLALGIGAHALDALGSQAVKPWGAVFSKRQLWAVAAGSVVLAYAIGINYIVRYAPLLGVIAVLEGFFLLAYNLEWLRGRFHTNAWFAFAWGFLPVLAGYVIQTNSISLAVVLIALAMAALSLVEINASRPYKALKRGADGLTTEGRAQAAQLEAILKSVSLGVILLSIALLIWRWTL